MSKLKNKLDTFGAISLISFSVLLGFNHVVIKVVNNGVQPVFFSGLRSLLAIVFVLLWMFWRKKKIKFQKSNFKNGFIIGLAFSLQFFCLFIALDFTSVIRTSILYYSMPIWLSILAHFFLPNEKLTVFKIFGLIIAFCGLVYMFSSFDENLDKSSLIGDFFALGGAFGWALIIFIAKGSNFSKETPEMQLLWMLLISGPILIFLSLFFGPIIRDFESIHIIGILFQSIIVVSGSFIFWLWLLSIYPASSVASFAFLTPLFGIFFGWFLMEEVLNINIFISAILISLGITLINKSNKIHEKI